MLPALTPACTIVLPRFALEALRSISVPLPLEVLVKVLRPVLSAVETLEAAKALVQLVARAQLGQIASGPAVARAVRTRAAWLRTYGTVYSRSEAYLSDAEHGVRGMEGAS